MERARIRLSWPDYEYLEAWIDLPNDLREILTRPVETDRSSVTVEMTTTAAERFRSELTVKLAKVGFDEDYELTAEGQRLEELIDTLQVF